MVSNKLGGTKMNKRKTLKLLKLLAKLGYELEAITDFAFMLYNDKKISGEVFEQVIINT